MFICKLKIYIEDLQCRAPCHKKEGAELEDFHYSGINNSSIGFGSRISIMAGYTSSGRGMDITRVIDRVSRISGILLPMILICGDNLYTTSVIPSSAKKKGPYL
jgi:hypothetical protein